jgi:hypothetical protein
MRGNRGNDDEISPKDKERVIKTESVAAATVFVGRLYPCTTAEQLQSDLKDASSIFSVPCTYFTTWNAGMRDWYQKSKNGADGDFKLK